MPVSAPSRGADTGLDAGGFPLLEWVRSAGAAEAYLQFNQILWIS